MRENFEVTIKIGKTKIVKTKSNSEYSVTEYWLNEGEKREASIAPIRYATNQNVLEVICKDILETFKSEL